MVLEMVASKEKKKRYRAWACSRVPELVGEKRNKHTPKRGRQGWFPVSIPLGLLLFVALSLSRSVSLPLSLSLSLSFFLSLSHTHR
ncbi:hypothetical protein LY78DRAFT_182483 [Colletotrichum sublineola]|nr:hypothetical protein LY78DRAFT_182483 [Colletotrichum sublineola]